MAPPEGFFFLQAPPTTKPTNYKHLILQRRPTTDNTMRNTATLNSNVIKNAIDQYN